MIADFFMYGLPPKNRTALLIEHITAKARRTLRKPSNPIFGKEGEEVAVIYIKI
jgi:hypothetical protein